MSVVISLLTYILFYYSFQWNIREQWCNIKWLQLLAPLSKSEFRITNTKEFVKYIQKQKIPDRYKMVLLVVFILIVLRALEKSIQGFFWRDN